MNAPRVDKGASLTKIVAIVVWLFGTIMTFNFMNQTTSGSWEFIQLAAISFGIQLVLTLGQSPIWTGSTKTWQISAMSLFCLVSDVLINFGGALSVMAQVDASGSIQAFSSTFFGTSADFPMWVKGMLALIVSIAIAGLPEYLWRLDMK
jgi:hypothetical protein